MFKYIIVSLTFFVVISSQAQNYKYEVNPTYYKPSRLWFFEDESYFVKIPAYTGYYTLYPIGYMCYYPIMLSSDSFDRFFAHSDTKSYTHNILGIAGYSILGTPFFALEKTFWDGPCYLYDSVFGDKDDGNVRKHRVPGQKNPPPQENDSEKR